MALWSDLRRLPGHAWKARDTGFSGSMSYSQVTVGVACARAVAEVLLELSADAAPRVRRVDDHPVHIDERGEAGREPTGLVVLLGCAAPRHRCARRWPSGRTR